MGNLNLYEEPKDTTVRESMSPSIYRRQSQGQNNQPSPINQPRSSSPVVELPPRKSTNPDIQPDNIEDSNESAENSVNNTSKSSPVREHHNNESNDDDGNSMTESEIGDISSKPEEKARPFSRRYMETDPLLGTQNEELRLALKERFEKAAERARQPFESSF